MTAQHKSESPWLTIVGVGEDGWDALSPAARRAIESAEILYGGLRHLSLVPRPAPPAFPGHPPWLRPSTKSSSNSEAAKSPSSPAGTPCSTA